MQTKDARHPKGIGQPIRLKGIRTAPERGICKGQAAANAGDPPRVVDRGLCNGRPIKA
jgi:hypothetical protein